MTIPESIKERIARIKAQNAAALESLKAPPEAIKEQSQPEQISSSLQLAKEVAQEISKAAKAVTKTPNEQQQKAVDLALTGESFCLCGAAGTGKTFTTQALTEKLLTAEHTEAIKSTTKYLHAGAPGIVLTAFTKRATKNAEEAIGNPSITCVNFHKLIEFEPVYFEVPDGKGGVRKTMRFEPKYNKNNPLPHISTILIEEASQFSIQMFDQLCDALPYPEKTQFIFIGDIQQIPPTMGMSIYGPKLVSLKSVELTEVYRQALESPIIRFLTDMRSGIPIERVDWKKYSRDANGERNDKMNFGVFPPGLDWEGALHQATGFLKEQFEAGIYNPYEDMVLVPFNVKFGTKAVNNEIAHFLDVKEGRTVYQVIAGWERKHFAVGDHVLYNTQDYIIKSIEPNKKYVGIDPEPPSKYIDREGSVTNRDEYIKEQAIKELNVDLPDADYEESDIEISEEQKAEILNRVQSVADFVQGQMGKGDQDEKFNSASHNIMLESLDDPTDPKITVNSTGDVMKLELSYAITVHKAQGLQAEKVYFFLHSSHSPMHFRELIYTAASRAKDTLTIITEPKFLARGTKQQRIPGVNLEQKREHFIRLLKENSLKTLGTKDFADKQAGFKKKETTPSNHVLGQDFQI